jgi:hypothetical protein
MRQDTTIRERAEQTPKVGLRAGGLGKCSEAGGPGFCGRPSVGGMPVLPFARRPRASRVRLLSNGTHHIRDRPYTATGQGPRTDEERESEN